MVRFENGQIEILDDGDISILAVRLEGNKVYYMDCKELRKLITPDYIVFTPHISEHWKFFCLSHILRIKGIETNIM
ncbi:hypothetical protein BSK67_18700 [Paenibacillus odorifer]|nr:hypothetical protein BSK67_18700 [Paenibacillus odorifer]